jgi:hypothetical protein
MSPEFLIPITLFVCITLSIKYVVDSRLRRRLAETHASEDLVRAMLLADEHARGQSALKWGLVLLSLGLAFIGIEIFKLDDESPGTWGSLILSAGIGMVGFHLLSRKDRPGSLRSESAAWSTRSKTADNEP